MSSAPFARDPDLARLLDDGYDVTIVAGHVLVKHIPYVTAAGSVEYGFLTYPVTVAGDAILPQCAHEIWFGGAHPHRASGTPLSMASANPRTVTNGIDAAFMLSSKPQPEGAYPDQYTKVTAYVRILSHEALAVDPTVTATPGGSWAEVDDDSPFVYRDTATSRAGLAALTARFHAHRVAIVGLGGTGSYILDQVAKTPVAEIVLIDGDHFENHSAFRAPGAATFDELRAHPLKVDYYRDHYSAMHRGITAHGAFLDEDNLDLLSGVSFAFLASDDATMKPPVIAWLEAR